MVESYCDSVSRRGPHPARLRHYVASASAAHAATVDRSAGTSLPRWAGEGASAARSYPSVIPAKPVPACFKPGSRDLVPFSI